MKILIVALFIAVIVVLGFFVFRFGNIGESKAEETWNVPTSGAISGTWGTTVEVEFKDGTVDTLNDAFAFSIAFKNKEVAYFRYILYSKVSSETYTTVDLDLISFYVLASVTDQSLSGLGTEIGDDTVTVTVDSDWTEVYRIVVDAEELSSLELEQTYNLSLVPTGSIQYRGSSSSDWKDVPPPSSYWINFKATDNVDGKYIEIGFEGEGT